MSGQVGQTQAPDGPGAQPVHLVTDGPRSPHLPPHAPRVATVPSERTIMKKAGTILIASVLATLIASAAFAGTPREARREARQHARIVQGRRNGQLTRPEAMRLRAGQRRIRRAERRADRDGFMSRAERRRIERMQDRQSARIYRLKHNARHSV